MILKFRSISFICLGIQIINPPIHKKNNIMLLRSILLLLFNTIYQVNCLPPYPTSFDNTEDKINKNGNLISKFMFQVGYNILVSVSCILNIIYRADEPINVIDYILFSLSILGTAIRFRAYYDLGPFFTFDLGIIKDHKLITTGIYKYLRHPGNAGSLLITIPLWIFTSVNIYFTVIMVSYTIYIFWNKIKYEEIMMDFSFNEYKNYSKVTKRFIPYIF